MATLKTIRRRVGSVKNTQKITKAMKMVAAAKLRRAQQKLVAARAYAEQTNEVLQSVVPRYVETAEYAKTPVQIAKFGLEGLFLLRKPTQIRKIEFLILSSDRGLCGGFNGNMLRQVEQFMKEKKTSNCEIRISMVGKKGRDFFKARKIEPEHFYTGMYEDYSYEAAKKFADEIVDNFSKETFDEIYLVYNQFKSAISQEITIRKLLPFVAMEAQEGGQELVNDYVYEPSPRAVVSTLLPRWLATQVNIAFLESMASEQGSRMAAMDSATNNSRDMIKKLTLQYNRLRQAAITKELMDIVNGAESL